MKKVSSGIMTVVFMVSMWVMPSWSVAHAEGNMESISYSAQMDFKSTLLDHVVAMYTRLSSLDEQGVHAALLEDVIGKKDSILAQVSRMDNAVTRHEIVSQVTTRFEEIRSSILAQSKNEILENLMVAQEELTHLGPEVILKGALAVLGTVALMPVFVGGCVLFVVGEVVYWGSLTLLAPVAVAIDVVGLALAGGSLAGAGVMWAWAISDDTR